MARPVIKRIQNRLIATSNLDPNSGVVNVTIDNPDTESEGSEGSQEAADRFVAAGHRFVREAREDPVVEAEIKASRAPKSSPTKATAG